jgi:plastocyanin
MIGVLLNANRYDMKKIFLVISLFLLIGAGCTGSNDVVVEDTPIDVDPRAEEREPARAPTEELLGVDDQPSTDDEDIDGAVEEEPGDEESADPDTSEAQDLDDQPLPTDSSDEVEEPVLSAKFVNMRSGNFFFAPASLTADPGQSVTVTISENSGFHTFVIDEIGFTARITEGGSFTFTAPTEPGSYAFYCDVGTHRAQGMEGVLVVE